MVPPLLEGPVGGSCLPSLSVKANLPAVLRYQVPSEISILFQI